MDGLFIQWFELYNDRVKLVVVETLPVNFRIWLPNAVAKYQSLPEGHTIYVCERSINEYLQK